jgi:PAS domain S-box-containing protein
MASADSAGILFESVHLRKDGSTFPVEVSSIGATIEGTRTLLSVIRDITERKRAEEALRQSEKILTISQRQTHIGSFEYEFARDHLQWSEEMFRIFGIRPEEFRGKPSDFLNQVHPDDRSVVDAIREQALSPDAGTLSSEFRIVRPDGAIRVIRMLFETTFDGKGRPSRRSGTFLDLTDARKADEERAELQARLLQAQKMEAVGQLAGGIAHDFNNMLGAMIMQLDTLRFEPRLAMEEVREVAAEILASANRAALLTRQLLLFSRRQAMRTAPHDLNAIVRDLTNMLRRMIHENIELAQDLSCEPLWIRGDAGMIEQVVANLCLNAQDAMPRGGELTLSTRTVVLDEELAGRRGAPRGVRMACLAVADTGSGMEPAVLEHIFEPFFTTKPQGKGTGLGLATVHGIVAEHRGFVEVKTKVGSGSAFSVYLPIAPASEDRAAQGPGPEAMRGGTESILVVEDDEFLRRAAVRLLRRLGYHVAEAADGAEALGAWQRENGRFDLLLTDMVMPGELSGLELYTRLRELKRDLRAIVVSGYSALDEGSASRLGIRTLAKPYDHSALAAAVRVCLDAGA